LRHGIDEHQERHRPASLRFSNHEDLWREIDRIAAADRAGRLRRTGNWTAGQTFGHLAAWTNFPYDGYPPGFGRRGLSG